MTRRSVATGAAVTVIGGVAGFAVASGSAAAEPKSGGTAANSSGYDVGGGTRLAGLAEVPAGGGLILDDDKIVLTRDGDEVLGFSAICTHQGCTVATVSGGTINCSCHGSKFDANTGEVVNGPASSPLEPVDVVVRNGAVFTA
jgi:Rieske Fe-S protein